MVFCCVFVCLHLQKYTMSEEPGFTISFLPEKGDRESFNLLFKRFYPRLTAYACLFVDTEVAEDLTQDLFVYLWEHSGEIRIHTSLESYLFKAMHQRCLNYIKQRKTHDYHHKLIDNYLAEHEEKLFDPNTNDSIRKLFMEELKTEINAAVDSLPEKCREVFMLSYFYDLKNKEISEVLGITVSTVENHIYNALKILRKKLSKHMNLIALLFSHI